MKLKLLCCLTLFSFHVRPAQSFISKKAVYYPIIAFILLKTGLSIYKNYCTSPHALDILHDKENENLPRMLCVHGFKENGQRDNRLFTSIKKVLDQYPSIPLSSFNFADASTYNSTNYSYCELAQEDDIQRLTQALASTKNLTQKGIILYGDSRGASTILTALGKYPNLVEDCHILGIILDSPFADLDHVINKKVYDIPGLSCITRFIAYTFVLRAHKMFGISPLSVLENIPKNLPIIIIHEKNDRFIPYSESELITKKLLQTNHTCVTCIITKGIGGHCSNTFKASTHLQNAIQNLLNQLPIEQPKLLQV